MNAVNDFVAVIRAVYDTASLVVTVVTVVMWTTIFRSWKRTKLREMARTLLFIQAVIGTSAHGTTTRNTDMENLYARMGPGKIEKIIIIVLGRMFFYLPFKWKQKMTKSPYSVGCHADMLLKLPLITVEPQLSEVQLLRYIEGSLLTNVRKNNQNVPYIDL